MGSVLLYFCAILPILLFLFFLLKIDAFSLSRGKHLANSILAGVLCCLVCHFLYKWTALGESKLAVSIIEESLKGALLLYLVLSRRVGLLSEATIQGSAIGVGFGLMENILKVSAAAHMNVGHAVLLGFEAAVMHEGCTSLLAMVLVMSLQGKFGQSRARKAAGYAAAFVAAYVVHFVHALEPLPPLILTTLLAVYFIYSKHHLFKQNERYIHDWIDSHIGGEVELLAAMQRGEFADTNAGRFLLEIQKDFTPEAFFDIWCYISEYLHLSIRVKSNLILKEAGMDPVRSDEDKARLAEFTVLKKRIGRTAEGTLRPLVNPENVARWATDALI